MASVAHVAFWVPGSPVPGVQSHIFCLIAARWPPEHPPHYHRLHAPARSNWSMWWQTTVPIILKVTIFTMFASAKYVTAELWGFCYYHCLLATSPRGGREGGREGESQDAQTAQSSYKPINLPLLLASFYHMNLVSHYEGFWSQRLMPTNLMTGQSLRDGLFLRTL